MAKLKCDQHKRRVFAIDGKFIHRAGSGDTCKSPTATIGDETYTADKIHRDGMKISSEVGAQPDKAKALLKQVFGG